MTIATLQRIIVALLAVGAMVAIGVGWALGRPLLGLITALVLLFVHAFILAVEFVLLWHVESSEVRPPVKALLSAWWAETIQTPAVFCWRQPFRAQAVADRLPALPDGGRGALLVHGLVCNRAFWNPWMERLACEGRSFMAITLEPPFGSIDDVYSDAIDRAVHRLREATGTAPVIVAHSMGGLAVRHWLQREGDAHRVHRVITIGTPHQGTWLARFGHSASARQMAVASDWLLRLAAGESEGTLSRFTCFYGRCDNVVFPSKNAQLPGADNRLVDGKAHVTLAFADEVFAETLRWLGPQPVGAQYTRSVDSRSEASSSPSVDTVR